MEVCLWRGRYSQLGDLLFKLGLWLNQMGISNGRGAPKEGNGVLGLLVALGLFV